MKVLSIETSCDETSVAVVEKDDNDTSVRLLSQSTSTSLDEHAITGGIIPEKAARRQLEFMLPVVEDTLKKLSKASPQETIKKSVDAIAVTQGPGLIGSLLVGVECAKTLSYAFDKPLIPVNHLLAHLYANFIGGGLVEFPFIGLIVSGGHTDLLYFKNHETFEWLGGTRDDAIGEALDKTGRRLGLSYPAGPEIEKRARRVKNTNIKFKSPLLHSDDFDFSYSGLKTEVVRYIDMHKSASERDVDNVCYAIQEAAFEVLARKTVRAAKEKNARSILVGGGVAANEKLKDQMGNEIKKQNLEVSLHFPEKKYTIDNAAMIGAWALFHPKSTDSFTVKAAPEMYFA